MPGANMDYLAGMSNEKTRTNDITARWTAAFFQRRWRLDATLGMHIEQFSNRPVFPASGASELCRMGHDSTSLAQFNPSVAGQCAGNSATGFNPCPVYGYQSGGYGEMQDINALRLAGQLKSTNIFHAAGLHELKYGFDGEFVQYGDKVWYSGPDGSRAIQIMSGGDPTYISQFRLPSGMQISQVDQPSDLLRAPYYQDAIQATTQQFNTALFLQESYSPLSHLTVNLGVRWETQTYAGLPGQHGAVHLRQHCTAGGRDL